MESVLMTEDSIAQRLGEIAGTLTTFMDQATREAADARTHRREVMTRVAKIESQYQKMLDRDAGLHKRIERVEALTGRLNATATKVVGATAVIGFLVLVFQQNVAEVLSQFFRSKN